VKRFEFRLARVRDLRRQQLEVEEAKLGSLMAERVALDGDLARIDSETAETRTALAAGAIAAEDRGVADRYLRHLAARKKRQERKIAEWQVRALTQRETVVEARRKVRLLESLEARRFAEWRAEADRERENLAAELYLARWNP
jgi:flagellar export protein FliJ